MGNTEGDFGPFEEKMKAEGLSEAAIDAFRHNYEQLVAGVTGLVRPPRLLAGTASLRGYRPHTHRAQDFPDVILWS